MKAAQPARPILVLTTQPGACEAALVAGADLVAKPFDPDLETVVGRCLLASSA